MLSRINVAEEGTNGTGGASTWPYGAFFKKSDQIMHAMKSNKFCGFRVDEHHKWFLYKFGYEFELHANVQCSNLPLACRVKISMKV